MAAYVVLFIHENGFVPSAFQCKATHTDDAEEQCLKAYPSGDIVWVVLTDDVEAAYQDYWGIEPDTSN